MYVKKYRLHIRGCCFHWTSNKDYDELNQSEAKEISNRKNNNETNNFYLCPPSKLKELWMKILNLDNILHSLLSVGNILALQGTCKCKYVFGIW